MVDIFCIVGWRWFPSLFIFAGGSERQRAQMARLMMAFIFIFGGWAPNQHDKYALAAQVPDRLTAGRFRGRYVSRVMS